MLLLSDGTVLAASRIPALPTEFPPSLPSKTWYRLNPDIRGHYVNGLWKFVADMHDTRLFYSSAVLQDGRVLVAGGEYGTGGSTSEIYDPVANTWTQIPVPAGLINSTRGFSDSGSKILANGSVLVAPVSPNSNNMTMIYSPAANTWSAGPTNVGSQNEASWVKLPDDSILTVDKNSTNSERYIPALNKWIPDRGVPVSLFDSIGKEIGAAFLLPNGKAFFLGGIGKTALYTPSGNTNPGTWVAGPDIPNGLVAQDAPAATMVNGKILCAFAPPIYCCDSAGMNVFPGPISFYEYDFSSGPIGSFTQVNRPTFSTINDPPYATMMLALPDGTVLYGHSFEGIFVYQPDGSPLASGKPTISSIAANSDSSFHLTGTLLNGISEGAAYGDDAQMDSNYPLVRLTDFLGNVHYARTYNWSSTSVMTGNRVMTTEFTVPVGTLFPGNYSLVVVANGISSDPVSITLPPSQDFYVNGASVDPLETGSTLHPFHTVGGANSASDIRRLNIVRIRGAHQAGLSFFNGHYSEQLRLEKPMRLEHWTDGEVVIGRP